MNVSAGPNCRGAMQLAALVLFGAFSYCAAQGDIIKVPHTIEAEQGVAFAYAVDSTTETIRFPYMASILKFDSHVCTGVLIKHNVVLTAAHCVDPTNPSHFKVRFFRTFGKETITVSQIKVHPGYRGRGGGSNLVLLKMVWSPSQAIGIQLSGQGSLGANSNERFAFLGRGRSSSSNGFTSQLFKADLPVVNQSYCSKKLGRPIRPSEFCAGAEGSGPCEGDDGGPLVRLRSNPESDVLVGIATSELTCGDSQRPDLFTRISEHASWLYSELDKL